MLYRWAEAELGLEAQELLVSLMIEPHGDLVDDLSDKMACDEQAEFTIDGGMSGAALLALIERDYRFAIETDFDDPQAQARFWYVSEEKLEPQLGERNEEPGADREQPLGIARDVRRTTIESYSNATAASASPNCYCAIRNFGRWSAASRVRRGTPMREIHDNLLSAEMRPIDLLRCKLACFGAMRSDPKSDRWVRITMFQNAPLPEDIGHCDPDDWVLPQVSGQGA